jgi:hypothetical protein
MMQGMCSGTRLNINEDRGERGWIRWVMTRMDKQT